MNSDRHEGIDFTKLELGGVRYVILRESVFERLCEMAGLEQIDASSSDDSLAAGLDLDRATLAEKLVRRRRAAGLSQAELARRADIRPETLNRIERGRTNPDFATVRKLVVAMNATERQQVAQCISAQSDKELNDADGQ